MNDAMKNVTNKAKAGLLASGVAGVLVGGAFVSAQAGAGEARPQTETQTEKTQAVNPLERGRGQGHHGQRHRGGPRGFGPGRFGPTVFGFGALERGLGLGLGRGFGWGLGGLSEGGTLGLTFYGGDPEAGGSELASLSFTAGRDSELAFRNAVADALEGATHVVLERSAQSYTVALPVTSAEASDDAPRLGWRLALRGLEVGDSVSVTFYDGDPEALGAELSTVAFTAGTDSELAFETALAEAAAGASFATVTTGPQTRTLELPASDPLEPAAPETPGTNG